MAAPAAASSAVPQPPPAPKTLMIAWHGREGRHGKDKGIFTAQVEPHVIIASDAAVKAAAEGKLQPSGGRVLKLLPGINPDVPAADWEKVQKSEAVKVHVELGNLEVIEGAEQSLRAFPPAKAISEFVKYTINRDLLDRWRRAETRADVLKAIEEHVAELNAKPTKQ